MSRELDSTSNEVNEEIEAIRSTTVRLHQLNSAYPSLKYAEVTGEIAADPALAEIAVNGLVGQYGFEFAHDREEPAVVCVYGEQFEEGVTALTRIADAVWSALQTTEDLWRASEEPNELSRHIPAVREDGAPLVLISSMIKWDLEYIPEMAAAARGCGVELVRTGPRPRVSRGKVRRDGNLLVLPGDVLLPKPSSVRHADFDRLLLAAESGEFELTHSLASVFALLAAPLHDWCDLEEAIQSLPSREQQIAIAQAASRPSSASPDELPAAPAGFLRKEDIRRTYPRLTAAQLDSVRKALEKWRKTNEDRVRTSDENPDTGRRRYDYPGDVVHRFVEEVLAKPPKRRR